jgi:hypothetical protein
MPLEAPTERDLPVLSFRGVPTMNTLEHQTGDDAINWLNGVVAITFMLSPWLLGFGEHPIASWNAWMSGTVIGIVALSTLITAYEWEEWLNLLLGLWVAVSPWILGFTAVSSATWAHLAAGALMTALSGIELWRLHASSPTRT